MYICGGGLGGQYHGAKVVKTLNHYSFMVCFYLSFIFS